MTSDFAEEASEGGSDTSSVKKLAESLSAIVETLNSASKGKVKRVNGPPRETSGRAHRRMWRTIASRGRSPRRQGEPLKSPRAKAKGKGKGLKCYVCGGIGHPARLCPSEGWVNDLEQDAPEGEDTDEEVCWTGEDDETLQRFLFDELSTRTARCVQRSWMDRGDPQIEKSPARRPATWVLDKRGMVLGSLWEMTTIGSWVKLLTTEPRKEWSRFPQLSTVEQKQTRSPRT